MTSVITNRSALVALQNLRTIGQDLDATSRRLASGRRIDSEADGAAYWSIAATLRADRSTGSSVASALRLDASVIDVAARSLAAVLTDVGEIRDLLTTAMSGSVDKAQVQRQIASLQEKIRTNAASASIHGRNWLSIDSANSQTWDRYAHFALAASRGGDGLSVSLDRLDLTSVALFDANTVTPHTPSVDGSIKIDQIYRLATSINASGLGSQVRAYAAGTDRVGGGVLRLEVRDPARTIAGSFQDGVATPVSGTPGPVPLSAESYGWNSFVDIPIANLSAGDVVQFQVSGGGVENFTVTSEGDGLDFSGSNEIHLEIRPFQAKYPGVLYDVVVNGAVLASQGVTGLSSVTHWTVVDEVARQINQQYRSLYDGQYPRDEVYVSAFNGGGLTFAVGASGRHSAVDVTVAPPTGANSLVDIGYGTTPGSGRSDAGFQEPARMVKGLLDSVASVATDWVELGGTTITRATRSVSVAGQGTALSITPQSTEKEILSLIRFVDQASQRVTALAGRLGGLRTLLVASADGSESRGRIQESAIGALVDADIEAEATRLRAVQAQRELGLQSLTISNAMPNSLLVLFRQ
ncbi:MAG: flagellin [Methylobacterium frigidaeris]